jgi:perosamine synthetase
MLSRRDGQLVGTIGTIGCFSLSNKLMLTGQGGLVVTDDDELAARGRLFRELFPRTSLQVPPAERLGTAYLMTDLEAAVGLAQLAKIGGYVRAQVAAADRLREMLAPLPGLRVLGDDPRSAPNRLFLAIRISPELLGPAAAFSAALAAEGVPHIYPYDLPIYRHPLFTERRTYGASGYPFTMDRPGGPADYTTVSLPVTEELVAETIVVRMSQAFTDGDVADIAAAISKVARGKARAAP